MWLCVVLNKVTKEAALSYLPNSYNNKNAIVQDIQNANFLFFIGVNSFEFTDKILRG